ncbi:ankyrin repeat-containing domain protein [Xylaria palmicola]|nr:ankyrin repeat-containing domain protein [Xylaria palmicola]
MADPLSIAGTAAGLVSLALQLSQESYRYVTGVRDSSVTLSSFIQQLSALQNVFLGLQKTLEDQAKHPDETIRSRKPDIAESALKDCINELKEVKAYLENKLGKGGLMAKLYAITWPFQEKEFEKKVQRLCYFNNIFSTALGRETYAISSANLSQIVKQRETDRWSKVVEWFRPTFGSQVDHSIMDNKCPDTGNALLSDALFLEWETGRKHLLWGFGQLGAGKTIAAATILNALRSKYPKPTIVTYHFFVAESSVQVADSFRHLVYRALKQCDEQLPLATELYERYENFNATLPVQDIVRVLVAIAESGIRLFIVLDGLDECHSLPELIQYLPNLTESSIKVFTTSRDLPNIRRHLGKSLNIEIRATADDIRKYVDWRLHKHDVIEFGLFKGKLGDEIAENLSDHVNGSFLLARLSMDYICSLSTVTEIRHCFKNLPTDYRNAYQSTLRRILDHPPNKSQRAQRSLLWVLHAKRALTMTELLCALASEKGEEIADEADFESAAKFILSACFGLLRLSTADQKVYFVHSSAKTFLRDEGEIFGLDANIHILKICLKYMSSTEMANGPCLHLNSLEGRLKLFPFINYAAQFYGYHAEASTINNNLELKRFLLDRNLRESSWQALHFVARTSHHSKKELFANLPTGPSLLHVAAYWGWSRLLYDATDGTLSSNEPEMILDSADSHGWTPLHWASSMGQDATVKALCDLGAAVDTVDSTNWTPLFWAAIKGYESIVSELISRGANVYHVDTYGMTASHWSVVAGHTAAAELLLEQEATAPLEEPEQNISEISNIKEMSVLKVKSIVALHKTTKSIFHLSAALLDPHKFARFLLSSTNRARRSKYWERYVPSGYSYVEPLFRTFWKIYDKGDLQDVYELKHEKPLSMFHDLLLHYAVQSEHVQLVEALLRFEKGVKFQKMDRYSAPDTTYFDNSYSYRSPAVVRMLLLYRDDVEQEDLLSHACASGSASVVKALLNAGIIPDELPISFFLAGAWRTQHYPGENLEILLALLDHGVSLVGLDDDGNDAMSLAMRFWDVDVLRLLAQLPAFFDVRNVDGMNVLHHLAIAPLEMSACRTDHLDMFQECPYNSLAYTIPDTAIESTLDFVFEHCNPHLAEQLAEAKLSAFLPTAHGTPLTFAIASGNWRLVDRLLLKQSRLETSISMSLLFQKAIEAGHLATVEFLLRHTSNHLQSVCVEDLGLEPVINGLASYVSPPRLHRGALKRISRCRCASPNYFAVLEQLVKAGGDTFIESDKTRKALAQAVDLGVDFGALKLLLDAGVDPYIPAWHGLDCFQFALLDGSEELCWYLWGYSKTHHRPSYWLQHSESTIFSITHEFVQALAVATAIDAPDDRGRTLLFNAALKGNQVLVEALLAHGANVEAADSAGWTPLYAAVYGGNPGTVNALLKAGADVTTSVLSLEISERTASSHKRELGPNLRCYRIIHLAVSQKAPCAEIVRLLLSHGVDMNDEAFLHRWSSAQTTPLGFLFSDESRYPGQCLSKTLQVAELLVQEGADIRDAVRNLKLGDVLMFENHETLWEKLRDGCFTD